MYAGLQRTLWWVSCSSACASSSSNLRLTIVGTEGDEGRGVREASWRGAWERAGWSEMHGMRVDSYGAPVSARQQCHCSPLRRSQSLCISKAQTLTAGTRETTINATGCNGLDIH